MPRFGEFETVGAPAEVTQERGYASTIWQARRVAAGENRLYAIKVYSPKQSSPEDSGAGKERLQAFVEGARQLQEAGAAGQETRLCPVHDVGLSQEGAWYATDFYRRGSLRTWISRLGGIDSVTLKHVLHEVVGGCLSLKHARGHGHGNLKPANVFLTGPSRALRKTRLLLADPYPAAPRYLAQWDFASRAAVPLVQPEGELQDVRALGGLLLQLVESRLVRTASDYNYPVGDSDQWQKLGRHADYWRQLCNRLLDPELAADTINLAMLERELRPEERTTRIPRVITGVGGVCLLVLIGFVAAQQLRQPAKSDTARLQPQAALEPQGVRSTTNSLSEFQRPLPEPAIVRLPEPHGFEASSSANAGHSGVEARGDPGTSAPPRRSVPESALPEPAGEKPRTWAELPSTAGGTTNAEAPTRDLETAKLHLDEGEYEKALAISGRYSNDVQFASVAGRAKAELKQFEQFRKRLEDGDYTFIRELAPQVYSSKPPFASLLKQAFSERRLLASLQAMTNSPIELQQRLDEPEIAGITKPAFQELRRWAKEQTTGLQRRDVQTARDMLAQGNYTNVLAICEKHPNDASFAKLQASARAELNVLATARTRLEKGDYGFIDSLRKEQFSTKPAFASVLDEATRERALLDSLQALRRAGKWEQLLARMAKADVVRIRKPPFEDLRNAVGSRTAELVKELRTHQARLGTLPRGEQTPLDDKGKPVVRLSRNRPATIYLAPLRQLRQDFQEMNQLTPERKREIEELETTIFKWFD